MSEPISNSYTLPDHPWIVGRFRSDGFELRDSEKRLIGWRSITGKLQLLSSPLSVDDLRAIVAWMDGHNG